MIKGTYTLEFLTEEGKQEFEAAINHEATGEGGWGYVLTPVAHKFLGWKHPNVHRTYLLQAMGD